MCTLEHPKCRDFVENLIHGKIEDKYPKVLLSLPIHDFRGDFMALKMTKPISTKNVKEFVESFSSKEHQELEVLSEEILEEEKDRGKLVALNLFAEVKKNPKEDMVVLFYRSSLNRDKELLEKYLELKEDFEKKEVGLFYYDVDKNSTFKDL